MIADVWTVAWKEWKEILGQRGTVLSILIFLGIFGLVLPWQTGRSWVTSPLGLLNAAFLPLFLVLGMVADSFAGERERHTLETLLATRLSDRAILAGKLIADIGYGWGLMIAGLALALVTVNLTAAAGRLIFYPAGPFAATMILGLFGAALVAAGGVLFSLRAATVRQAQQALSVGMMVLIFVPFFALRALPHEIRNRLADWVRSAGLPALAVAAGLVLLALDVVLLAVVAVRFQRAKLVLDE